MGDATGQGLVSRALEAFIVSLGALGPQEVLLAESARKLARYVDSLEEDSGKSELTEIRILTEQLRAAAERRKAGTAPAEETDVEKKQREVAERRKQQ